MPALAPIAVFLFGPLIHEWWTLERNCLYLGHEFLIPTKYRDLDRIGELTTRKQIEANRRNSRMSTGPKTRTGKAESKMNAMKHGLLAEQVAVRGEDPVEFAGVLESLIDEFQPQGPLEEQLVERVAACMWRLRRLYRVEAGILIHESLTIELDRARDEARSFVKIEEKFDLGSLTGPNVHITDEKRHGQAIARVEKATRLLQAESLALGVAFK